jgi:hypothetical protein
MRARLLVVTCTAFALQFAISPPLGAVPSAPVGVFSAPVGVQQRSTAEAPPQLIGTWRLNVAKSKYSPGPPLRSETRVYSRQADGVKGVVSRVHADGRPERFEYMANFGKDIMVTGIPDYDSVTLRKVDDLTSDAVLSHAGTVYGVARRAIAADGKTMTITFDRKSSETPVHNVAVYDKVSN